MKPFYVVLLMGAAAMGGGLVVRYSDRPVEITLGHAVPPKVVAPPIPPNARVAPSTSVPVHLEAARPPVAMRDSPPAAKPFKPSAFSDLQSTYKAPPESRIVARVRIPPEPPAVTPIDHTLLASRVPAAPVAVAPVPSSAPQHPAAPEPNHATLKAGMLIAVRINEALSSNLNSKGDVFSGTLDRPLIADGFVIAERGAKVRGEVVDSKSGERGAELTIRLREILASDGQRVHVVSELWRKAGNNGVAAPRNVYDVALTRGGAAVVRPATSVTFRLDESVELTEKR